MSYPHSILLAEDDPQYAFILQIALQQAGVNCPVQLVSNREELLRYLEGKGRYKDRQMYPLPKLVILGLRLPLLNDFQALRWIRQHHEFDGVSIVILSGMQFEEEGQMALELGANSYDPKPTEFHELVQLLERMRDQWLQPGIERAAA